MPSAVFAIASCAAHSTRRRSIQHSNAVMAERSPSAISRRSFALSVSRVDISRRLASIQNASPVADDCGGSSGGQSAASRAISPDIQSIAPNQNFAASRIRAFQHGGRPRSTMNAAIHNRESTAPRTPTWQQIEVAGEHRARLGDEAIVQVIDAVALRDIAGQWEADMRVPHFDGLLVDADHLSHDPANSTEAKAWLLDLEIRNGQLWGLLDWTDTGAEAIRGRRYKYFSTEYAAGDLEDLGAGPDGARRVRPRRLAGLALTNRPNNRGGRPITNRKGAESPEQNPTQANTKPMKTIAEKLGLPPEATADEILAAIDTLQAAADEAGAIKADAAAEEILNRNAKRIPEGQRDAWKAELLRNREGAERLILTLPEAPEKKETPEPRPAITNRETAKTPEAARANGDAAPADEAKAARIRNRAAEIDKAHRCGWNRAWSLAQAEIG